MNFIYFLLGIIITILVLLYLDRDKNDDVIDNNINPGLKSFYWLKPRYIERRYIRRMLRKKRL